MQSNSIQERNTMKPIDFFAEMMQEAKRTIKTNKKERIAKLLKTLTPTQQPLPVVDFLGD